MDLIQENVSALASKLGVEPEVIAKFLTDAHASEEVKPFAESLGSLHIFNPADLTTRLTNERKAAADEAERLTKGNLFGLLDKRIKEATGIEKSTDESRDSLAYAERAFKEAFGAKPGANESEEVKALRQDLAAAKELLGVKEAALQNATTKLQGMEVEYATNLQAQQFNSDLDTAINKLDIEVPDTKLLPGQRKLLKVEFDERFEVKMKDGRRSITDRKTGKEMRNDKTADPMSVEEVVASFAPTVVSLKKTQKYGAGIQAANDSSHQGLGSIGDFASLDDYKKHLTEGGITLSSQVGQDKIAAYIAARDKK